MSVHEEGGSEMSGWGAAGATEVPGAHRGRMPRRQSDARSEADEDTTGVASAAPVGGVEGTDAALLAGAAIGEAFPVGIPERSSTTTSATTIQTVWERVRDRWGLVPPGLRSTEEPSFSLTDTRVECILSSSDVAGFGCSTAGSRTSAEPLDDHLPLPE
jgi:hypothetical protein